MRAIRCNLIGHFISSGTFSHSTCSPAGWSTRSRGPTRPQTRRTNDSWRAGLATTGTVLSFLSFFPPTTKIRGSLSLVAPRSHGPANAPCASPMHVCLCQVAGVKKSFQVAKGPSSTNRRSLHPGFYTRKVYERRRGWGERCNHANEVSIPPRKSIY